jgi:3-oxo-5-alpha-steroid 4-dehydrogenase 3
MAALQTLLDGLATIPPSTYCQTFFVLAATSVLSLQLLPDEARTTLMDYGARRPNDSSAPQSKLLKVLAKVTSVGQVPHSYFWHFYLLSSCLSGFWAWEYVSRGRVLGLVAERQASTSGHPSMELGRVLMAWMMMALQGGRRLYECFCVVKPGRTPMWFVHWVLGLAFYAVMSVSVWVEGSGKSSLLPRTEGNRADCVHEGGYGCFTMVANVFKGRFLSRGKGLRWRHF